LPEPVVPRNVAPDRCFALPDATSRPPHALVIPDIAYITREYPNVRKLHIFGDGVYAYDAETLRNLRIVFHAPSNIRATPAITFARLPGEVHIGDPVIIQGRVEGIASETSPVLAILAPDGSSRSINLKPGTDGIAPFSLTAPPGVAVGRFLWRMELHASGDGDVLAREDVGISVIQPALPRVLVLESSPRFDTGRLQRWLGEHGASMTVRTRLARDRFRVIDSPGSNTNVENIDPQALADFDLVLADASVISSMKEAERDALRSAINDQGLGLIIVADESVLDAAAGSDGNSRDGFFFPWTQVRDSAAEAGEERLSRLRWTGSESAKPEPLPVPAVEIARDERAQSLVRDGQDRTLVAALPRGRGRIALSLVRQTWRWSQLNDSTAFAAYWSFLFSELSRRGDSLGRWSIANNNGGPSFVNEPLTLRWTGIPDRAPMPAEVTVEGVTLPESLPLAQSATNPHQWKSTYWPRQSGWFQVRAPGAATMDFYVSSRNSWPALQAARRQAATAQIALFSSASEQPPAAPPPVPVEWGRWFYFAILFVSLCYLWLESRTSRLQPSA
jgi:hypothetical protein